MGISLDKALGIQPATIRLRTERLELLASNLANADTPGYKARDINFLEMLDAATTGGNMLPLARTQARHLSPPPDAMPMNPERMYRVPSQPSLDGNTVDPQLEHAAFTENAMHLQASLEFIERRFSGLQSTLRIDP